jgi:integrase
MDSTADGMSGRVTIAVSQINRAADHPAAVYVASLSSATSRRTMRNTLDGLARLISGDENATALTLRWEQLRYGHLVALRTRLQASYAPATVNRMLSAVRGVLKAAWMLDLIDGETYRKSVTIKSVSAERLPAGRDLATGEIARLIAACKADTSAAGARDGAILAVLYGAGLRRAECIALDVRDYDPSDGRIIIRAGKGNKDRVAYIGAGGRAALRNWLAYRGKEAGRLFVTVNRGGVIGRDGFTTTALYNVIQKRAAQAGIAHISPHDLRRTHVTHLLDAGADTLIVSKIAGHADPKTTARYDRRADAAAKAAAELLDFPY